MGGRRAFLRQNPRFGGSPSAPPPDSSQLSMRTQLRLDRGRGPVVPVTPKGGVGLQRLVRGRVTQRGDSSEPDASAMPTAKKEPAESPRERRPETKCRAPFAFPLQPARLSGSRSDQGSGIQASVNSGRFGAPD